jgi:hypothetical protein
MPLSPLEQTGPTARKPLFVVAAGRATNHTRTLASAGGQDYGARRSMNDRIEPAMTASDAEPASSAASPPALPPLTAFLGADEHRLRDLIAYGLATQAGRLGPDGIEGLRRKAEAELHAHAFRTLHNEAERIRRDAAEEERARSSRGGFGRLVGANLVALGVFAAAAAMLLAASPAMVQRLAQLAGRG